MVVPSPAWRATTAAAVVRLALSSWVRDSKATKMLRPCGFWLSCGLPPFPCTIPPARPVVARGLPGAAGKRRPPWCGSGGYPLSRLLPKRSQSLSPCHVCRRTDRAAHYPPPTCTGSPSPPAEALAVSLPMPCLSKNRSSCALPPSNMHRISLAFQPSRLRLLTKLTPTPRPRCLPLHSKHSTIPYDTLAQSAAGAWQS